MSRQSYVKSLSTLFVAFIFLAGFLEASEPYASVCEIGITECDSDVSQIKNNENWRSLIIINLDNGLWASEPKNGKIKPKLNRWLN